MPLTVTAIFVHSQIAKVVISFSVTVHLSVCVEQLGSHWTDILEI